MHLSYVRFVSFLAAGMVITAGVIDPSSDIRFRPAGLPLLHRIVADGSLLSDDRALQTLSSIRQAIRNQAVLIRINEGLLQGLEDDHGNLPVRNWESLGQAAYRATWLRIKSQVDTANAWVDRYNSAVDSLARTPDGLGLDHVPRQYLYIMPHFVYPLWPSDLDIAAPDLNSA